MHSDIQHHLWFMFDASFANDIATYDVAKSFIKNN